MRNLPLSKQILGLAGWLAITFLAAAVGTAASVNASSFYGQLMQPTWAPPAWLFGPVWTTLFVLMAVAAWLAWREKGFHAARTALILFLAQLVLNALWSWLFFAWQRGMLAFVDIIVLWIMIVATIIAFFRVQALAGWLLVPYLLWVTFAAVLNYEMWQLNSEILG